MINQEVKEFMGILLHVVIELLWKEEENTINVERVISLTHH